VVQPKRNRVGGREVTEAATVRKRRSVTGLGKFEQPPGGIRLTPLDGIGCAQGEGAAICKRNRRKEGSAFGDWMCLTFAKGIIVGIGKEWVGPDRGRKGTFGHPDDSKVVKRNGGYPVNRANHNAFPKASG
jgi:hypothetical protein